jgi:hypothetical protein
MYSFVFLFKKNAPPGAHTSDGAKDPLQLSNCAAQYSVDVLRIYAVNASGGQL